MKLSKVLANTDIPLAEELASVEISNVSYDSRRVQKGDAFIALDGLKTKGTDFAIDAERKGASVYIGERRTEGIKIPQLITSNARKTLAVACANFFDNPQNKMRIVGITGTNGKTSTAFMLKNILSHGGYKSALMGTVKSMIGEDEYIPNVEVECKNRFSVMTTPDPDVLYMAMRDMVKEGVEVLVMEVSSHALALEKLAPINFEIGIFTNLSNEHLDFHRNMEDYFLAKQKLFDNCRIGIVNADDDYGKRIIEKSPCNIISFGADSKAECKADDIKLHGSSGSEYVFKAHNARFKVKTTVPGRFTVYNSLAAVSAARMFNINLVTIQNAIYAMNGVCGRLQRVKLPNVHNFSVFIDYAHTPFALKNLLNCVNEFKNAYQRVVTLFGCGGDRDKQKRAQMGALATQMSDFVIITDDNSRNEDSGGIINDILKGVGDVENYIVIPNRKKAIEYAIEHAMPQDIILLVGKGHENYEIDKDGMHPFSEIEIVENAVAKKG